MKKFQQIISQIIPNSLVSNSKDDLMGFLQQQEDIIVKPLNQMGGRSIFRVTNKDSNAMLFLKQ